MRRRRYLIYSVRTYVCMYVEGTTFPTVLQFDEVQRTYMSTAYRQADSLYLKQVLTVGLAWLSCLCEGMVRAGMLWHGNITVSQGQSMYLQAIQ